MAKKHPNNKTRAKHSADEVRLDTSAEKHQPTQNDPGSWSGVVQYARSVWAVPQVRKAWLWLIGPALLYMVLFFLMQPHYFGNFGNGFYLDNGDGFQNVWNIWWVNHSITVDHANPYYTTMLHWPGGTSLLPQTMNIYNGLVAIPLIHVFGLSLVEATNFAVLSAFVLGGVTMFWFIQKLYGKYWVALLAGGLFTFSTYHFAHAQGHLQLVSFQFVPLFLLAFWQLIEKVRYRYACAAAGALFLVLLCDYYYFFWSAIVAGLWFAWQFWKKKVRLNKQNLKVFATFAIVVGMLCGPLVFSLMRLNKHDPLTGFHDPATFSLDPVTVFMPGGSWYWHTLTDSYTAHLPYLAESSVYFGVGLILLVCIAFFRSVIRRRETATSKSTGDTAYWWIVLFSFGILALGPRLHAFHHTLGAVPLPYEWLMRIFPSLEISGMPMRWIFVSLIAAIVLGAWALATTNLRTVKGRIFIAAIVIISLIDLWPRTLPLTPTTYRPYVSALQSLPYGAVIDDGALTSSEQLYNQTKHEKPIAFGYVTRLPQSVNDKDFHIFAALAQGRYADLCRVYKIRYLTLPVGRPLPTTTYPVIYNDGDTLIYNLKNSPNC